VTSGTLTLAALAPRPLWVAWQQEDRPDGKPTKVPYAPDGRKARADTPATWGSRSAAEQRAAALPKPYGVGGVGIELACLRDGRSLAGIDLDSCRDSVDGALETWAEDVAAAFDSYAEVSPSGTGAKIFFTYDTAALADFQSVMGTSRFGKQFKRGGGDHPPAIELHLGNRFYTVTDAVLPGSTPELRHVEPSRILRLIQADGRAFAQTSEADPKRSTGKSPGGSDRSRSAAAFSVGKRSVMDGADFEAMCAALRLDPETAGWMREKGEACNLREARRIFAKAKQAGPLIRVVAGELHHAATAGEAAIRTATLPIFQRGNSLMRPVVQDVPAARGRMTVSAALLEVTSTGLVDALCGVATWVRHDERAKDWVRINPPLVVAQTILSRAGMWSLPKIVGVVTTPTIRPDGSILFKPGYDADTRLFHAADPAITLADAVHRPGRADTEAALSDLKALLAEFPFTSEVSRAIALSGLITPVVRGAMSVVPLHAFRANTAGTGKTYLADLASAIATGRPCPVASAAPDEGETEKRLTGLLLAGYPLVSLDNVNGELGGDLLCQAIERPFIRIRPLGASEIVEIESRATLFATGNALRVRGDMTRRTVVCDLDAGIERPELRAFTSDPFAEVIADRGHYVSACLTIVRAYRLAERRLALRPIASFREWSETVRTALVWLGCDDPVASMETAREDDPELAELREVIGLWREALPVGEGCTLKAVVTEAMKYEPTRMGEPTELAHPEFWDALLRLAGERGAINTKRLGRWLMNREGRIVDGHRSKRTDEAHGGVWRWAVQKS